MSAPILPIRVPHLSVLKAGDHHPSAKGAAEGCWAVRRPAVTAAVVGGGVARGRMRQGHDTEAGPGDGPDGMQGGEEEREVGRDED